MPTDTLLDLAQARLAELTESEEPATTLDAVLLRLADPEQRELETICAFGSAL